MHFAQKTQNRHIQSLNNFFSNEKQNPDVFMFAVQHFKSEKEEMTLS